MISLFLTQVILPHIMACAYICNYLEDSEKIIGGSFRDATRVAKINENLWR